MLETGDRRMLALGSTAAIASGATLLWLWRRRATAAAAAGSPPPIAATSFDAYLRNRELGRQQPVEAAAAPQFAASSFEAYLRQPAATTAAAVAVHQPSGASASASAAAPAGAAAAPSHARPITVLFGTEYGFSKEVAQRVCQRLRDAADTGSSTSGSGGGSGSGDCCYWPQLLDMAELPQGLPGLGSSSSGTSGQHQALLLVCSTLGDGVPPTEAREFCDWLAGPQAPRLGPAAEGSAPVHFSVCALGDK